MESRLLITLAVFLLATICYFPHPGQGYYVFPNNITVSGLSAGGFMAVQFTVAFSSVIKGLGVFAGGPYYCAQGSETTAEIDCTQLYQNVNVQTLIADAQKFAEDGDIDDLSNLNGLPLYLYSGEFDTVVNPAIVKMVPEFFQGVATGINVSSEYSIPSEHCLPTLDYGSSCIILGPPYINKCDYDGAGQALQAIYGTLQPSVNFDSTNIIQFDQQQFIPQGDTSAGLAPNAYVYVPTACRNNATCTLHVVFHGCNQSYLKIENDYYQNGGYNGWAEANNIIILYPQADSSFISNPEGCFDWWGYTNSNYAFKTSSQMATFMNMINYVASNKANF